ncbi:hypothetical protein AVEN_48297-1 [Araneus ventricosus]|uniref:Uncharacterized protein n=1 Tax=Araneus ventricosus TaxID=182803 RepID=A0A4Y2J7B9_ARAVE|nr:hypothetical protein AVEN_48297-1 [Araneus ventricosus]
MEVIGQERRVVGLAVSPTSAGVKRERKKKAARAEGAGSAEVRAARRRRVSEVLFIWCKEKSRACQSDGAKESNCAV